MTVDPKILQALSDAISDLKHNPQQAIPQPVLKALAPLAKPGMKLKLDMDASQTLGAPLVVIGNAEEHDNEAELLQGLTKRQKEVAQLIIEGLSNPEIADKLNISLATVKDHVHAILSRLELNSRVSLIKAAHHSGKA